MNIEEELTSLHPELQEEQPEDRDLELMKGVKSKKKKKKSKLELEIRRALASNDNASSDIEMEDELAFVLGYNGKSKKEILGDGDLFDDTKGSSKKQSKAIENKFKPELTNLNKLLKENESSAKALNSLLQPLLSGKTRASSKFLSDLLMILNSTNSNRLATIREITNIKKSIIDLKIKAEKDKGQDNDLPSDQFGSRMFEELFKQGRSNVINTANEYQNIDSYDMNDNRSFDEICDDRLSSETNSYRSEDGNKMIKYEARQPKFCIQKSFNTGDIAVVAVDNEGVIIEDYPVPSVEDLGKLTFNSETNTATDKTGRVFQVIDVN